MERLKLNMLINWQKRAKFKRMRRNECPIVSLRRTSFTKQGKIMLKMIQRNAQEFHLSKYKQIRTVMSDLLSGLSLANVLYMEPTTSLL